METFSALLAICAGNSPVPGEFPTQRPVTRSFDVYFDLRPNKRLSKRSWGWWFETQSRPLWRHRNAHICLLTNNILFLVMVTMGMWSPCGLMNPISSYVLLSIFDDRINRCTVSNIHIQLKFFIFWWSPRNDNTNIPISWYSDNFCHHIQDVMFSSKKLLSRNIPLKRALNRSTQLISVKLKNILFRNLAPK